MVDELKLLNSIRGLRAAARDLPLDFLEMVLQKVRRVVSERREKELSRKKVQDEHNERLEKLRLLLLEKGIDPAELVPSPAGDEKPAKVGSPRKARDVRLRSLRNSWLQASRWMIFLFDQRLITSDFTLSL